MTTKAERIDMAREAETLIAEAVENLKAAVQGLSCEKNHLAYLVCRLECTIGAGGWMSGDSTVADLIKDIEAEVAEDEEDLVEMTARCLRDAGYAVSVTGGNIEVSLTNRRPGCAEVLRAMDDVVPQEFLRPTERGVLIDLAAFVS